MKAEESEQVLKALTKSVKTAKGGIGAFQSTIQNPQFPVSNVLGMTETDAFMTGDC